jgi:hypothetical protein
LYLWQLRTRTKKKHAAGRSSRKTAIHRAPEANGISCKNIYVLTRAHKGCILNPRLVE